jgi:hypothetical protein
MLPGVSSRILFAAVALLVSGVAEAGTRARGERRVAARRAPVTMTLGSAIAARDWTSVPDEARRARVGEEDPAPTASPALRSVLPPGVLAALVDAAERGARSAPRPWSDGLSWRELRPKDESGTRIVPLAIGRF